MMDEDDFFGGDEQEAQKRIAERELARLESDFITMGFRQGALEAIEDKEKEALNKGLQDGMEMTQLQGYLQGKIEFIHSIVQKFSKRISPEGVQQIQLALSSLSTLTPNELGEEAIKQQIQKVLEIIGKQIEQTNKPNEVAA